MKGDMVRQHQPVGAGHRHICLSQGADDVLEQRLALSHQDDDVSIPGRPWLAVPSIDGVAPRLEGANLQGDPLGQPAMGAVFPFKIDRQVPGFARVSGNLFLQGPEIDAARVLGAKGLMPEDDIANRRADAVPGLLRGEDRIDHVQNGPHGSVGGGERRPDRPPLDAGDPVDVALGFRQQPVGVSALKAVDRLLFIADDEQGAVRRPGRPGPAFTGKELVGQGPGDVPLFRRRVLGLVDQDMLYAFVQLVEHPGRPGGASHQIPGPGHQVDKVQHAAIRLGLAVGLAVGPAEGEDADGILGDPRPATLFPGRPQPELFRQKVRLDVGVLLQNRSGFSPFGRIAFAAVDKEEWKQPVESGFRCAGRFPQDPRPALVGG